MGQVSIHLNHRIVACAQCPGEAGQIRPSETFLARAMQHMDAACAAGRCGQRVGKLPGAVRGVVVYNKHIHMGGLFQDFFGDLLKVAGFIVGRYNHDCTDFRVF